MTKKIHKPVTADDRDLHLANFISQGLATINICRQSGATEEGLSVGRSVFPICVTMIHRAMVGGMTGLSVSQRLEDLYSSGIIDELTHANLRRAAAAMGEYGTGRDLGDVYTACDLLRMILKSDAYKTAAAERKAERAARRERRGMGKAEAGRRRPALIRWATAAAGLFTVGQ